VKAWSRRDHALPTCNICWWPTFVFDLLTSNFVLHLSADLECPIRSWAIRVKTTIWPAAVVAHASYHVTYGVKIVTYLKYPILICLLSILYNLCEASMTIIRVVYTEESLLHCFSGLTSSKTILRINAQSILQYNYSLFCGIHLIIF